SAWSDGTLSQRKGSASQVLRKGCELKVLTRRLVDGFDGLCKVLEAVQDFFERHAVFVIDASRNDFRNLASTLPFCLRVPASNLQALLHLLDARRPPYTPSPPPPPPRAPPP